jgi:YidC/Oxa1 family membrane protein insertase
MDKNSIIGWSLMAVLMILLLNTMNRMKKEQLENMPKTEQVQTPTDTPNKNTIPNSGDSSVVISNINAGDTVVLSDSLIQQKSTAVYGVFAGAANGTAEEIVVENDVLKVVFSSKGAIPTSVILKNYKTHDQQTLEVYNIKDGAFNLKLYTNDNNNGSIYTDSLFFTPTVTKSDAGTEVSFKIDAGQGRYYEHKYVIPSKGYMIDFAVNINELQSIIAKDYLSLHWAQTMPSQEGSLQAEKMYSSVYYADENYKVEKLGYRKSASKDLVKDLKWVSFKQKFFNSTLITYDVFDHDPSGIVATVQPDVDDNYVKKVSTDLVINYNRGGKFEYPMQMYFGPNNYKDLKALDIKLEKVVQIGASIFRWVNLYMIMPTFNLLNNFIGNYGIIILILTLLIKLVLFPFTYKSHLSMIKMRVLQPELTELKKKFGKDQAKLGPAQMELYRKAGVNPLGGCLPMLFQMPILIAMYRFFPSSIELRQESFLWAHDLSTYDAIISWSQDIPLITPMLGNHISLFTLLMAISSFFYTKLNSQNTPMDSSNPMAVQMKMFQYIMPFMMIFIFNKFSAALSYYYLLFNVFSIAQHLFMKQFLIDEDKIHAQIQENKTKIKSKSKWQIRMEEMMKQQQEMQKKRK